MANPVLNLTKVADLHEAALLDKIQALFDKGDSLENLSIQVTSQQAREIFDYFNTKSVGSSQGFKYVSPFGEHTIWPVSAKALEEETE